MISLKRGIKNKTNVNHNSKNLKLVDAKNRLVAARGGRLEVTKWVKVQTSSYKISHSPSLL